MPSALPLKTKIKVPSTPSKPTTSISHTKNDELKSYKLNLDGTFVNNSSINYNIK